MNLNTLNNNLTKNLQQKIQLTNDIQEIDFQNQKLNQRITYYKMLNK